MAVVEAMALRVPVVAGAKSGGVPWVLDHGRAGFLTNVREPRAMAETLLACIRNADERAQKTRNAYERATTYFSPRVVAEKYERIYEQVLAVA